MNKQFFSRQSVVGALVWLLVVVAVGTTPWAMAKYAATGMGGARARIAKYEPRFAQVAGYTGAAGLTVRTTSHAGGAIPVSTFAFPKQYVRNKSEVSVNVKPYLAYVPRPYNATNSTQLHNLYYVGDYYDNASTAAYVLIPAAGVEGGATGRTHLLNSTFFSADTTANRALASAGTDISAATATAYFAPNQVAPAGSLFHTTVQATNGAAVNARGNVNGASSTATTYDMNGYWRTYRLTTVLQATQVD
ncbi:MAG: hypothetical protein FWD16_03115 [Clostridia bacterium]|nr:hypothetical protein [Clostridia bacterium]